MQRIRRRLRHLKSLEARNLRDEGSNESLEASACFYKLWQQTPDAKQDQQAMTWLYTSEQVHMMPPCETCIRSSRSRLHCFVTGLLLSLSLSASDGMTSFNVPYRCMGAPPLNGERYILAIGKTSHMPACMACIQTSSTCIYMLPRLPLSCSRQQMTAASADPLSLRQIPSTTPSLPLPTTSRLPQAA